MEDYFHYDIAYVENITDVDDKIILRAHMNLLQTVVQQLRKGLGTKIPNEAKDAFKTADAILDISRLTKPTLVELKSAVATIKALGKKFGKPFIDIMHTISFNSLTYFTQMQWLLTYWRNSQILLV